MRGQKDLRLVAALALACAALALLIPVEGISLVFAIPLVLVLPGYAIAAVAFARRDLPWPQFLLLSIALSLATLILGSLLLNYLGGVRPLSWALLLVIVVIACCRGAAIRRGTAGRAPAWPRPRPRRLQLAMLLAAVAAATGAIVLSATPVPVDDALGYTQLWVLPEAGSEGREAQVGVRSQQQGPANYDLRIRIGEDEVVKRSFELAPGESRIVKLRAPPGASGTLPVIATLLLHNRPTSVYRRVKGTLVVSPEQR